MKEIRFSISKLLGTVKTYDGREIYLFFFRTDWMNELDSRAILQELKQAFPAPRWKITKETKETHQTTEIIN